MNDPDCIFCKIVHGEIPSSKLHEDEDVLAFHDVRPQAPVHFLIVPREHVATLYDAGMAQHRALGKMSGAAGCRWRGRIPSLSTTTMLTAIGDAVAIPRFTLPVPGRPANGSGSSSRPR